MGYRGSGLSWIGLGPPLDSNQNPYKGRNSLWTINSRFRKNLVSWKEVAAMVETVKVSSIFSFIFRAASSSPGILVFP